MTAGPAASSHPQPEASGREGIGGGPRFLKSQASFQWHTSPYKATPPIFSKPEPTKEQVFKYPRIVGAISSQWPQPLLIIVPKDSMPYKDTWSFVFICTSCSKARKWNQPWCLLTDEWELKLLYTYTIERCSAAKKSKTCRGKKWVELEIIIVNEVTDTQKHRPQYTHSYTRMLALHL